MKLLETSKSTQTSTDGKLLKCSAVNKSGKLPSHVRRIKLFYEKLNIEIQNFISAHTGDYRFMIQSPDGGFRWFTNPKSTQIKRDSGCNNVNYFENNKFVQLQHDEDRTTIRIKTNQSKCWS